MSTDDQRAIIRIDRERYMTALRDQLDAAWKAALSLPADHPRREPALQAIQEAWYTNQALCELIQSAESALSAAHNAMTELRQQRDQVAGELSDIVEAAQNVWMTEHPVIAPLYDKLMEAHNAAFWESLPYDMASMLGGDWNSTDADLLYNALTADEEEVDEDGFNFGFTHDQLVAFRADLRKFLKAYLE